SAMLAIGASVGGVVTAVFGRDVAFVVNSASFFVSAIFIAATRYDATPAARPRRTRAIDLTGIPDLVDGLRYVRRHAHVAALALAPMLSLATVCVLFAHFGGSILWVFSTVLLQMEVPDEFRGRVFAAELALVTLTSSLSSYLTGYYLDAGTSPRTVSFALGA